jgi:uncharacterized protein YndB with AHSA1/START domain
MLIKGVFMYTFNPELDLKLEMNVPLSASHLYKAWTTPELLQEWFCPKPWTVSHCEMDLCSGGKFNTTMKSPEGQEMENFGCFIELVENKKIVWTDSMTEGFRPTTKGFMTATVTFEEISSNQTLYKVHVQHANMQDKKNHEEMGFVAGWTMAMNQLIELMKNK